MTRDEVVKIIFAIKNTYPNWMPNATEKDLGEVANAWSFILEDYEAVDVLYALKGYATTTNSGFAPSVNQLIDCIHKPEEASYPTEVEAWGMVRKAINNGTYNSVKCWEALPEIVQKAVTPDNIREWASTPIDSIETVIASNFQRSYRTVVARESYEARLPHDQKEKTLIDIRERMLLDGSI